MKIFQPKILIALKGYTRQQFFADLMAGSIVAVVALPLAIAFTIASGVAPEKGLYTAIVAGIIVAVLGGCKTQIGGPTGSFIVILYVLVEQYGVVGLAIVTFMSGVMLILMGSFRLGSIIKFIPYPVIVGFTTGIAITIFALQIKDLFGMQIESVPADFIQKWVVYGKHIHTTHLWSVGVGILSIIIIALTPKFSKRIPGSLIAIIVLTAGVYIGREYYGITGIETIGDRFTIQASLPKPEFPEFSFDLVKTLFPTAVTLAIFGAIESLLSATIADGVTGDKHDSNTELIAQGVANVVSPIFGGVPATGALARTMTNINNGGKTPVAGIAHSVVLLLILLFLSDLTKHIPMACLAGILVMVSYNMSEWRTFRSLLKSPKSDLAVLLTTFFLTIIFDLSIAIEIGLLLAVVLFIRRISETTSISLFRKEVAQATYVEGNVDHEKLALPKGVEVYEIEGPFFFGIASKFDEVTKLIAEQHKVRIIRMRKVPFIDSSGVHNLEMLLKRSKDKGIQIVLSGVKPEVYKVLLQTGIVSSLGEENVCSNISCALVRAKELTNEGE